MKKTTIACIAFLITVFSVAAVDRNPIDLVVLLDTSSSMYPSRKEVSEYIVGPLLTEFLKLGDTFHLLSFSDTTRNEISRKIEGPEDIETIIARLLLMYPLNPHTDFISALNDIHQYLTELPESRTKTVVLISDGEHSPKAGSPNGGLSAEETAKRIEASSARLKGNGWNFYLIKIPFAGKNAPAKLSIAADTKKTQKTFVGEEKSDNSRDTARPTEKSLDEKKTEPKNGSKKVPLSEKSATLSTDGNKPTAETQIDSGKPIQAVDVTEVVSETLASPVVEWSKDEGAKNVGAAIGLVFAEFPTDLGKKSRSFSIPVKIRNSSASSMYLETNAVNIDGTDRMAKRSFQSLKPHSDGVIDLYVKLPDSYLSGTAKLFVAPVFAGTIRLLPDQSTIGIFINDAPFSRFFGAAAPYFVFGIGFVLAVLLLLIIIAFLRRSFAAPNRAAARASGGSSNVVVVSSPSALPAANRALISVGDQDHPSVPIS
ncbi:MAG: vWA domain-containing protein [Treponemataceae bacterium]